MRWRPGTTEMAQVAATEGGDRGCGSDELGEEEASCFRAYQGTSGLSCLGADHAVSNQACADTSSCQAGLPIWPPLETRLRRRSKSE